MSADDIVSRLRNVPEVRHRMSGPEMNPYYHRCQEAADEIERLRLETRKFPDLIEHHLEVIEAERRGDRWKDACHALAAALNLSPSYLSEFLAKRGLEVDK